ncbi:pH-response regulator protein palH/rim21 [Fusarium piperis]|uniref:PH-response regulator protein palH/rim21 n=1 Tax=Fusarium piperis TaxID=1435070 RepID=A0A9W8WGX2_9HYPO|nr:pH-response regulator protein palH/rim21 [Fusarium piperis]
MDASQLVSATITALPALCTTTLLPAAGIMTLGPQGVPVPLIEPAVFQIPCPVANLVPRVAVEVSGDDSSLTQHEASESNPRLSDFRDPFYASIFPICYALAATTVTAYMLVIMLFVTPRSFLDGGIVYLGRRSGFTHSSSSSVSIGGRPWLQKVAALTVAISLTIATADTFKVAQKQYMWGIQNAKQLQDEVMNSVELKVIRLVSDTFLWLAQVQTLIRLFPRQREKIIIKWVAFALITLDVIFSAITSFQYSDNGINTNVRPKNFVHPVPALSYLFQLSLGLLYAAWVVYFALMKKRYAFYHPFMKNITLVAIISITSILIPVVFFILDISQPEFTGWGDYVRWVGAAAASVVVWEWVERIEALEREEKKDGILGREVFDGDDTLEINAAEFPWLRNRKTRKGGGGGGGNGGGGGGGGQASSGATNGWTNVSAITSRYRGQDNEGAQETTEQSGQRSMGNILRPAIWPTRPAPAVTPISRTDTASAASTVYAVRYPPSSEATTRTPEPLPQQSMVDLSRQSSFPQSHQTSDEPSPPSQAPASVQNGHVVSPAPRQPIDLEANTPNTPTHGGWRNLTFASPIFRRSSEDPPQEVAQHAQHTQQTAEPAREGRTNVTSRWDLRARLEDFAANQAEKLRDRVRSAPNTESLPVTVIPAPPRRGAALQQVLEEEELNTTEQQSSSREGLTNNGGSNSNSYSYSSMSREASGEVTQLDRSRSTLSGSQGEVPIPATNPPLWRGVQPRVMYEDDYYYSGDDDSVSERSSLDRRRQDLDSPGPQRAA